MKFEENTLFKEIKLPKSVKKRRKLLSQYNGRFVLVKDEHLFFRNNPSYRLIKLNYSEEGPGVYHTINPNTYNPIHLHVNDLEGLLVQVG